jgi:hypothetical protein
MDWKLLIPFFILVASCKAPQVITNTSTVKTEVRDSIIYTPSKAIRDTLRLFEVKDTVIYQDRVLVRVVSDMAVSDSLRDVINELNLQLEVICPDDSVTVQVERTVINDNNTVIEKEAGFLEKYWLELVLGAIAILTAMRLINKLTV